jgi:phosphatidylethanolamine-binding protein (PEBP) family uncharacterized protein
MNLDNYKNFIKLYFGLNEIKYGELLKKQETTIEPTIQFNKKRDKYYTIIIIDPDAPSPTNPTYKYFLHMLKTNSNVNTVEYTGPNPPINSGIHRYYTCVFEHDKPISNTIESFSRPNFDLKSYVKENKLNILGCHKFTVKG